MRTKLQIVQGSEYIVVTRVLFGWDVVDRRGNTFVSALDFPALQSKGLDEFVDGRSVAGVIVDRALAA
jgi:hypothetical protein